MYLGWGFGPFARGPHPDFALYAGWQRNRLTCQLPRPIVIEKIEIDSICSGVSSHEARPIGGWSLRKVRGHGSRHVADAIFRRGHKKRCEIEMKLIMRKSQKNSGEQRQINEGQSEDARREFHGVLQLGRNARFEHQITDTANRLDEPRRLWIVTQFAAQR